MASEHGDDYDDNNPLQRLILPLISTPEVEMQMAVNAFELAGACIFCIIICNKPQQLIGEQFIASNNSVVGFQLVVESILILHSEGAQVASASLQTFADGDQAASQSDTSELIVETPSLLMLRNFKCSAITAVMNGSFSFKFIVASHSEGARFAPNFDRPSDLDSSKLIVVFLEISLHFCEDYRIFREGEYQVKNDGYAIDKQRSYLFNILDGSSASSASASLAL